MSVDAGGTSQASGPAVIDASAVLAWLRDEPGADTVAGRLDGSFLSAVNLSEVLQKHLAVGALSGQEAAGFAGDLASLGLSVVPFCEREAAVAAVMWDETRRLGLGLADRACMATAVGFGLPALTADRPWVEVEWKGLSVDLIR
ncbi:MAG: type II toxin-antitoxin system VapC family toxin [Actinomycetota bacterium]|nr:type II toxin-antitoxin system VapC family toxin [Actinomycetota bacterium]